MFEARAAKALAARPAIPRLSLKLAQQAEARRYARLAEHKQVLVNNHNQAVETH